MFDKFINLYPSFIGLGLWLVFPIFFFLICKFVNTNLLKISAFSITAYFILLFNYLGLPVLYYGMDTFRAVEISSVEIIFINGVLSSLALLFMLLGYRFVFLSVKVANNDSEPIEKFIFTQTSKFPFIRVSLTILSVFVLYLYIEKVGLENLAILTLANNTDNFGAVDSRSIMVNAFEGNYHWYKLFMRDLLWLVNLTFFIDWLASRNFKFLILSIITGLLLIFVLIMTTEKMPVLEYFISLTLASMYLNYNRSIKLGQSFIIILFLSILIIILYIFFMGNQGENIFFSIGGASSRILTGAIHASYLQLEFFLEHGLMMGITLPNPGSLLPFEPFPLTQYIWFINNDAKLGVTGSMPAIFWTEGLINFGFLGYFLFTSLAGMLLGFIDLVFKSHKNSVLYAATYIFLIMHIKNLSISGFSNYLFDPLLFILIGIGIHENLQKKI